MGFETQNKTGPSFFSYAESHAVARSKVTQEPAFVDVGGRGDCGYRSIAAGFIDNCLAHPRRMSNDTIGKFLALHFRYFPQQRPTMHGLVTPVERMQQMIKREPRGELIQAMAYTFRQMAVDELCEHSARYRGAFVDANEQTSPEEMRKPTTWIDESSIAALAAALSMPIEVHLVGRLKTLPSCFHYNYSDSETSLPVVIKLEGSHYMPRVTLPEQFSQVRLQTMRTIEPVIIVRENDPSMPEILAKIAAEDERIVKEFEDRYHQLKGMVTAGELNLEKLLAIYVQGMDHSDYLSGRAACVTVEHGNQDFFDSILRAKRGKSIDTSTTSTRDSDIVKELIHAIARAISIGQMSEEKVFEHIEETQTVSRGLVSS